MIHPSASPATPGPFDAEDLARDLARLGVRRADKVIAHVSLSRLGWVAGGGIALLRALRWVVGPDGCVVVPSFTTYLVDPAMWTNRGVPAAWHDKIRRSLPGFDPHLHETQPGIGRFAELVRTAPGAVRSNHPIYSLSAVGEPATRLLADSPRDWTLGSAGALARFADSGGLVLAIGVAWWAKCTLFHLAEHLADYPGRRMYEPVARTSGPGGDYWLPTRQLVFHDGDFEAIGSDLADLPAHGTVGAAPAALLDAASLAEGAATWLLEHRDLRGARFPPPYERARPAPAGAL